MHTVVNELLIKPEASLPDGGSLDQLTNIFSAFCQDKVRLIQENLTLKADPNYVPPDESPGTVDDKLSIFLPVTEDEVLFTLYIGQIVRRHRLHFNLFADDSQLYVSFKIKDTNDKMADWHASRQVWNN